jgi:hypothetical protein
MDQETALLSLRNINETVTDKTLQCLNDIVLSDPDFFTSPGGTVRHHNFKHGLVIHTAEVMMNAFMMSPCLQAWGYKAYSAARRKVFALRTKS